MLFNSIEFAIYLPIVFLLYWFVFQRNLKLQNLFIVAASYLFYGWWDWKFLLLIALTTFCSWISGVWIGSLRDKATSKSSQVNYAKLITGANIVLNLGILGFFKYYNFFVESFVEAFSLFGQSLEISTLRIILPVGISFYTFQALSYSIDVYRKKIEPTGDIVSFFAFVSFFPQLVAGPIERATNLLPQFFKPRSFDYMQAVEGSRQILWGLFKKVVIADNCAVYVNDIFGQYQTLPGSVLLLGAIYFAFQIYADFSGYSDIAIGTAKLFGFTLMRNFSYPYFSRDIAEFWRRWHISLSTWFRDYLYIPLGGSREGLYKSIRNTLIIFTVSGLWHGANWTFVGWGAYHGLLFLPLLLMGKNRAFTNTVAAGSGLPSIKEFLQMATTFGLVVIGWIFFRAESITEAFAYIGGLLDLQPIKAMTTSLNNERYAFEMLPLILLFVLIEWVSRQSETPLTSGKWLTVRSVVVIAMILMFGNFVDYSSFIYFAF